MSSRRRSSVIRTGGLVAAGLLVVAASAPAPRRARSVVTPARYKLALAPIQSCGDFFRRAGALPDATPLLRTLFTDDIPQQGAGETADAFVGRVVERLFARLGEPSRLVTAVPITASSHYDGPSQTMTIMLAQPFEAVLDSWAEAPARTQATRTELRASFGFPPGALPRSVALPMTSAEASRFSAGSGKLQILSLFQDYGTGSASPGAGKDARATTEYRLVRLTPKCAVFTSDGAPLPGWRFDGWNAAPNAG